MSTSHMPQFYPGGGPLRWQDDVTGEMQSAVKAFLNEGLGRSACTPFHIELVRQYLEYYLNAPCWTLVGMEQEFADLRNRVKELRTAREIAAWIVDCLETGIDPL